MARLVAFNEERNKAAFLEELAYTRSLGLGQGLLSGGGRQFVLWSGKRFDFRVKKCFVAGAFGNFRKGFVNPRIHRRNLFKGLYKQASARIGIGQGAMGTVAFNFEFLHERIEAVVRNILESDARKSERIPKHVGIVRNPDLGKSLLEELGIENSIVCDNREFADKRANLPGHSRKVRSFGQIRFANAGKRFDKGA